MRWKCDLIAFFMLAINFVIVGFFSFTLFLFFLLPTCPPLTLFISLLSGHHHTLVCVYRSCVYVLWLILSSSFIQSLPALLSDSCQSVPCIHASLSTSILFVGLFCFNLEYLSVIFPYYPVSSLNFSSHFPLIFNFISLCYIISCHTHPHCYMKRCQENDQLAITSVIIVSNLLLPQHGK